MKINVTNEIEKTIQNELIKQEKEIDQQISSVSIRPQLISAWEELQRPITLYEFGYLYLQPKSIAFDNINFQNQKATSNLQMTLSPTVLTNKKTTVKKTTLPTAMQQPVANKFELYKKYF